jgi:hypothetical protein
MTKEIDTLATRIAAGLRTWADGLRPHEAAAELLIEALDGRLLTGPWIRHMPTGTRMLDADVAAAETGHLSGGERRVLAIAVSLIDERRPVDLGDAITGLDRDTLQLVLQALAHAADGVTSVSALAPVPIDDWFNREYERRVWALIDLTRDAGIDREVALGYLEGYWPHDDDDDEDDEDTTKETS